MKINPYKKPPDPHSHSSIQNFFFFPKHVTAEYSSAGTVRTGQLPGIKNFKFILLPDLQAAF